MKYIIEVEIDEPVGVDDVTYSNKMLGLLKDWVIEQEQDRLCSVGVSKIISKRKRKKKGHIVKDMSIFRRPRLV